MMAGKPVIQAIDAGNNIVRDADCGFYVEPDNVREISRAIISLKNMSEEERARIGGNGRRYVLANHTYGVLAKRFADVMTNILEK